MAIDPRLSLAVRPPAPVDFGGMVEGIQNMQLARQRAELQRQEFLQRQREYQERDAFKAVLGETQGDIAAALPRLYAINPEMASKIHGSWLDTNLTDLKIRQAIGDTIAQQYEGVTDQHGYDVANTTARALRKKYGIDDGNDEMPAQFTPEVVQGVIKKYTPWREQVEQEKVRLQGERDQLKAQLEADREARADQREARADTREERMARAQEAQLGMQREQLGISRGQLAVAQGNLRVREQEAKDKAEGKDAKTADGKPKMTPSMQAGISRLRNTIGRIKEMDKALTQRTGPLGKIEGYGQTVGTWLGLAEDADVYQGLSDSLLPALARSSGEVGNLAEKEQTRYARLAPQITDPINVRRLKIGAIERLVAAAEGGASAEDMSKILDYERGAATPTAAKPAAPAGGAVEVKAPNGKTYSFQTVAQAEAFKLRAGIK